MKSERRRRARQAKDSASLAEKAYRIEETQLVPKRLAMSIALCQDCALPEARKPQGYVE